MPCYHIYKLFHLFDKYLQSPTSGWGLLSPEGVNELMADPNPARMELVFQWEGLDGKESLVKGLRV